MLRDESISHLLNRSLTRIREKLGIKGTIICGKDLNEISECIHQFSQMPHKPENNTILLSNLVVCIESIIKKIDQEALRLEVEMNGVNNYSDYFYGLLKEYECKKLLRDELKRMLVNLPLP